jgi:hypothetical protein
MKEAKFFIKYKTGDSIEVTDKRNNNDSVSDIRFRFEKYLITKRQGSHTFAFHDPSIDSADDYADNIVLSVDFRDISTIIEYKIE